MSIAARLRLLINLNVRLNARLEATCPHMYLGEISLITPISQIEPSGSIKQIFYPVNINEYNLLGITLDPRHLTFNVYFRLLIAQNDNKYANTKY